jgi:hypothetical protein
MYYYFPLIVVADLLVVHLCACYARVFGFSFGKFVIGVAGENRFIEVSLVFK